MTTATRIQGPLSRRSKQDRLGCFIWVASLSLFCLATAIAVTLLAQAFSHVDQIDSDSRNSAASDSQATREQIIAEHPSKEILKLTLTNVGVIQITLRPEFSEESIEYIHKILDEGCLRCNFYRAEKRGILQGMIVNKKVPLPTNRGRCPPGFENITNDCPEWDKNCACHGPVMERGNVAWAAGDTGPDFFINDYEERALWWGTQHTGKFEAYMNYDLLHKPPVKTCQLCLSSRNTLGTSWKVWGLIEDNESFKVLDKVWSLPAKEEDGSTYLETVIQFQMEIMTEYLSSI